MSQLCECAARRQSLPEPGECDWPHCGCDVHAVKVLEALHEEGWRAPADVPALQRDNEILTHALQRIEAGESDPIGIAKAALDRPSHKALFG
jgi:hypothetical protein